VAIRAELPSSAPAVAHRDLGDERLDHHLDRGEDHDGDHERRTVDRHVVEECVRHQQPDGVGDEVQDGGDQQADHASDVRARTVIGRTVRLRAGSGVTPPG